MIASLNCHVLLKDLMPDYCRLRRRNDFQLEKKHKLGQGLPKRQFITAFTGTGILEESIKNILIKKSCKGNV